MKKFFPLMIFILLSTNSFAANNNPIKAPVWSDLEKYQSNYIKTIPFINQEYVAFAGLNYGFKNGVGIDAMISKRLNRYMFGGVRFFLGSLNSQALVRPPVAAETTAPSTSDMTDILSNPENWFAFVPEIGFSVETQILPIRDENWSESAWFGIGKAFIGGRSGYAISFESGINKKLTNSDFGWSIKGKYTFGWLYALNEGVGTVPYDWLNLTAGVFYSW
jgi:hypothetical protein